MSICDRWVRSFLLVEVVSAVFSDFWIHCNDVVFAHWHVGLFLYLGSTVLCRVYSASASAVCVCVPMDIVVILKVILLPPTVRDSQVW